MLDINRPYIGGERWFGIFVATAITISPQAPKILFHILMNNLIKICSFLVYRHSLWRHWCRVHRILWLLKIRIKLVEKDRLEFLLPQHWWWVHKHPKILLILMPPLINICSLWEYRHCPWQLWSRSSTSNTLLDRSVLNWWRKMAGLEYWSCSSPQEPKLYASWWPIWSIYVGIDLVYIEYFSR